MDQARWLCGSGQSRARRFHVGYTIIGFVALATLLLSACGDDPNQPRAQASKARLDQEIAHAQSDLGLSTALFTPLLAQERMLASGANYAEAARGYEGLLAQVQQLEAANVEIVKSKTARDLDLLAKTINEKRTQGFTDANAYQLRLNQALADLNAAKTTSDFARIDEQAVGQMQALHAITPVLQRLQDFKAILRSMGATGATNQALYDQDMQVFHDASTSAGYTGLAKVIDGQMTQLMAEQTASTPFIGATLLKRFQSDIDQLRQYGDASAASNFQPQHDDLANKLAKASQLSDYLTLAQQINRQETAMALPLARGQAKSDLDHLMALIAQGQNTKVGGYPAAYEYADQERGYGDAANAVNRAKTLDDYMAADDQVRILSLNLQALLDNLNDQTGHDVAHQADLRLLQAYGALTGKAIVVSLREQVARLYEDGKVVYWTDVTTGRPEKPSPPGLHYAMFKQTDLIFSSPDPAGTPLYYAPTKVNFGILYANYGFFLHDAYWRRHFGPGSNLPHYDPAAFNGGSHGCINFPESNMAWVYNWTPVGSPIIVY